MATCRFLVETKKEPLSEESKQRKSDKKRKCTLSLTRISEKTSVLTYGRARAFLPDQEADQAIICIQTNPGVKTDWVTATLEKNFEVTLTPVDPTGKRRHFYR
ncbi:MAG: hypothetical protein EOM19_02060 [Candidatus Moranbacteria bacterium]|nr:hypothetical protein [Candidatus Moranbacteria bacterium]